MRQYLLLLGVFLVIAFQACTPANPGQTSPPPTPSDIPSAVQVVALVVHLPDDQPSKVWEVEADRDMSVKELMDALAGAQFQFKDTLYPGMGHLVTNILGMQNPGKDGEYWQFCLDNVASDRGVDEGRVAPGHQVDWYFTKYGELPCKKIGE
jgi:Domain of unknown function (DUF4430)